MAGCVGGGVEGGAQDWKGARSDVRWKEDLLWTGIVGSAAAQRLASAPTVPLPLTPTGARGSPGIKEHEHSWSGEERSQ